MKLAFARKFGSGISKTVEFNTIDGFQGQEKDIVIFSCVRAGAAADIGFLSDARRMNVGLTRAQKSMFIIGRAFTLSGDPHWKILVQRAKEQDQYSQINMRRLAVQGRISYSNLLLSPPPEPAKDTKAKITSSDHAPPPPAKSLDSSSLARQNLPNAGAEDPNGNPSPKKEPQLHKPNPGGKRAKAQLSKPNPKGQPVKVEASSKVQPTPSNKGRQSSISPSLDAYTPIKRPALASLPGPPFKDPKVQAQATQTAPTPAKHLDNPSPSYQSPKHDWPSHMHPSHRPSNAHPPQHSTARGHQYHPSNYPFQDYPAPSVSIKGCSKVPHRLPDLSRANHYPYPQDMQYAYPPRPEFIPHPQDMQYAYPPRPESIPHPHEFPYQQFHPPPGSQDFCYHDKDGRYP
ncbi:DEAD-box type RNA helicase [Entomophthora muscae]|uniref:DEAD-box type RNA helicase n=1 Tax=Entomophthora muscae TaxID=34485 RepID=A0ACC2UFP6_9FUNG|nr:DEAD-box type RNA helicase [Entomophthora muscae]